MIDLNTITKILKQCIEPINDELPNEHKVCIDEDTLLLAEGSSFDSLQLVSIIVDFEEELTRRCKTVISLTTDEAMSLSESPFRSVRTLAKYAEQVLIE